MGRREEILDAACGLLSDEGEKAFTLEKLAQKVGLTRVSLYRYFRGKKLLFKALVEERGIELESVDLPDVRTRILKAAEAIFGKVGYTSATVESIAQEAGVGVATVYRQFGDKAGLLKVFMEGRNTVRRSIELLEQSDLSLEAFLETIIEVFLTELHEHKGLMTMMFIERGHSEELANALSQRELRASRILMGFFEERMRSGELEEADPMELTMMLMGSILSFSWIAPRAEDYELKDPKHLARLITKVFLHGAKKVPGNKG